jgi:hypothetical protein
LIKSMNCRLCDGQKPLKESHIIPRFFYKPMEWKEKNFRYQTFGVDSNRIITGQGGIKERLLCEDCEQKFSVLENYVHKTLYGGLELAFTTLSNRKWRVSGLDYNKLKLFQLSILWRASVSSQIFFKSVSLGKKHEFSIKKMLLDQDPGPPEKYACILVAIIFENDVINDLMLNPTYVKKGGHRIYRFVFGGFAWAYFVSSHSIPDSVRHAAINKNGNMIVSALEMQRLGMIMGLINNFKTSGLI